MFKSSTLYWNQGWYVWNNTGDKARLITPAGSLVDTCQWGSGSGYRACSLARGAADDPGLNNERFKPLCLPKGLTARRNVIHSERIERGLDVRRPQRCRASGLVPRPQ